MECKDKWEGAIGGRRDAFSEFGTRSQMCAGVDARQSELNINTVIIYHPYSGMCSLFTCGIA